MRVTMTRWFSRLGLMAKILLPAGLMIAVTAAIILYSRFALSDLNAVNRQVVDEDSAALIAVLEIQEALYSAADKEKAAILASDAAAVKDHADALVEELDGAREAAETLTSLAETAEQKDQAAKMTASIESYAGYTAQTMKLAADQKDDEALALATGAGQEARVAADELGDTIREAMGGKIEEAKAESAQVYASSVTWLIGGSIIGVLAATTTLVWVVLSGVTRPVRSMTQTMRRLADGDLDVTVHAQHRSDEIGLMARAVQVFKDSA